MATNVRFVAKNGVDTNSNSITNLGATGASLALSGANAVTLTSTAPTNVTLPTTGTLISTTAGNAVTASKLLATKNINGVAFDGSANITVPAAAGTLTGTSLPATVTGSSLTSFGTLSSLNVSGALSVGTLTTTTLATIGSDLVVTGNLTVNGTTTTINSTTISTSDLNITLAKDAATAVAANGAGITIAGANATLLYANVDDSFNFNKKVSATSFAGPLTGNVTGNTSGTAGNVTGVVAIANGGTGAITAPLALTALGAAPAAGSSSIVTVGTIATGTWTATDVALAYGGTNASLTAVNGGVVYSNTTGMAITAAGTTGQVLTSAGAAAPTWSTLSVTPANFASQTQKTFLAAPNAANGTPTFRVISASDIPTLNQNTTGSAASLSTPLAVASGGTGATAVTGTGTNVLNTSPTLVTPVLGEATATSINGTTIPTSKVLLTTTDAIASVGVTVNSIGNITASTLTTSTTAANQTISTLPSATYRSVKYTITVTSGAAYHYTEVSAIHDGTTAYISETGTMSTGASLAIFDVSISGGNILLTSTPTNAATTIKVVAIATVV